MKNPLTLFRDHPHRRDAYRLGDAIKQSREGIEIVHLTWPWTIAELLLIARTLQAARHIGGVYQGPGLVDVWGGRSRNMDSMQWRLRVTVGE